MATSKPKVSPPSEYETTFRRNMWEASEAMEVVMLEMTKLRGENAKMRLIIRELTRKRRRR